MSDKPAWNTPRVTEIQEENMTTDTNVHTAFNVFAAAVKRARVELASIAGSYSAHADPDVRQGASALNALATSLGNAVTEAEGHITSLRPHVAPHSSAATSSGIVSQRPTYANLPRNPGESDADYKIRNDANVKRQQESVAQVNKDLSEKGQTTPPPNPPTR